MDYTYDNLLRKYINVKLMWTLRVFEMYVVHKVYSMNCQIIAMPTQQYLNTKDTLDSFTRIRVIQSRNSLIFSMFLLNIFNTFIYSYC